MPADPKVAQAWLDALSMPKFQGCGHVRLTMEKFPEYGLSSIDIPKALIKAYYKYL
jgi:hypothetical protein